MKKQYEKAHPPTHLEQTMNNLVESGPAPHGVKLWGKVRPVVRLPSCHVDLLDVCRGGFSSLHTHERKDNLFVVLSGVFAIALYVPGECRTLGGDVWVRHVLTRLDSCSPPYQVPAGVPHRFECWQAGKMLELYFPSPAGIGVDENDIDRHLPGGLLTDQGGDASDPSVISFPTEFVHGR